MNTVFKSVSSRVLCFFIATAPAFLPMCGGQSQDEPPSTEGASVEEPLSNDELKSVTNEFELEAEEAINAENLVDEVEKLEREIADDK